MTSIPKQISLFPILLVNFIGTMGFSIVLPFLVFLVTDFGGNALVFGIVAAMYPAFQLIGAPILGRWSDHYGRKKVLLVSQGGTLVAWVIFLVALFLPVEHILAVDSPVFGTFVITLPLLVLFLARGLDGITGGNVSVANAYLADVTPENDRSKNFGRMAISSNLGFIVGPAIAGVLGATIFEEALPVMAAMFLSLAAVFVIKFSLKESKPSVIKKNLEKGSVRKVFDHECKDCDEIHDPKKISFKEVIKLKNIRYLLSLYFAIFLGFNIFYVSFPIYAAKGLEWTVTELGMFFVVLAGLMALVQGPVLAKASRRFSEGKLVVMGSIILAANFVLFVSNDIILLYGAAVLFAVGNGLMWPSVLSILSKCAGNDHQGAVQGIASSFGSLASIIGLIAGGILYGFFQETIFFISAGIIFIVFIMSFKILKLKY
ncbi:MAG TPA: MFS transporter [Nitrosopumilaceae archaeon]|nr:MFS transporter [Nitrosopumilaceae archaeon]